MTEKRFDPRHETIHDGSYVWNKSNIKDFRNDGPTLIRVGEEEYWSKFLIIIIDDNGDITTRNNHEQ